MQIDINVQERKIIITYNEGEVGEILNVIGDNPMRKIATLAIDQRFEKKKEEVK